MTPPNASEIKLQLEWEQRDLAVARETRQWMDPCEHCGAEPTGVHAEAEFAYSFKFTLRPCGHWTRRIKIYEQTRAMPGTLAALMEEWSALDD